MFIIPSNGKLELYSTTTAEYVIALLAGDVDRVFTGRIEANQIVKIPEPGATELERGIFSFSINNIAGQESKVLVQIRAGEDLELLNQANLEPGDSLAWDITDGWVLRDADYHEKRTDSSQILIEMLQKKYNEQQAFIGKLQDTINAIEERLRKLERP